MLARVRQLAASLSVFADDPRTRPHVSETALSPERALSNLRRIRHHRVTLNGTQPVTGISSISKEQTAILSALTIKKPTLNTQLTLL